MKEKNQLRLYNFIFLPWMVWYLPFLLPMLADPILRIILFLILAANFAYDSLVLYLAMRRRGLQGKLRIWKKSIWRIWSIGFASDVAGTMLMTAVTTFFHSVLKIHFDPLWRAALVNILMAVIPGIALAGTLIYFLNRRFSFAKCGLDPAEVRQLSLALAVFTAPYLLFLGSHLL